MIDVALLEPEIPPNTGNIMRLCANTGARLHLIQPLSFRLDEASLRRAGLDYRDHASVQVHASLSAALEALAPVRVLGYSARGGTRHDLFVYRAGDLLLFGPETRGLHAALAGRFEPDAWITLPQAAGSRSLNLSNAVAVAVYEVWRQQGFAGAARGA
jgi:tRNA (cytidine/uridine-2'-O-)-methyltransferase